MQHIFLTLVLVATSTTASASETTFFEYRGGDEQLILEYIEPLGFLANDESGKERMPLYHLRMYANGNVVRTNVTKDNLFAEVEETLTKTEMDDLFSVLFQKRLFEFDQEELDRRISRHTDGQMTTTPNQNGVKLHVLNVEVFEPNRSEKRTFDFEIAVGELRHTARLLGDDELHDLADAVQVLRTKFFGLTGDMQR